VVLFWLLKVHNRNSILEVKTSLNKPHNRWNSIDVPVPNLIFQNRKLNGPYIIDVDMVFDKQKTTSFPK
jgi:hypothetical protein